MKKKIIATIVFIFLSVAILISIVGMSLRREIPLVDGLYWGMSPAKATMLFGDSYESESNFCDTGKTVYCYRATVFGEEAEISCVFWKGRKLSDISFRWDDNIESIAEQAYDCLYEYYHDKEGFFLDADDPISLGLDYSGPILRYQIIKDDTTITVSCIDLR